MRERLFLRLDGDPLYAPETSVPTGAMSELAVAAPLRQSVSHIVMCQEDIPPGHELVERVLPDGAARFFSGSNLIAEANYNSINPA